jgi:hypothetical protein
VAANGLADSVWKSGFKDALSFHLQSGAAGCFFRTRLGMVRSGEHRQSLRLFANSSKILFGLGAVLFVLLYIFGACATVVHLRGRERLRLGRQIFDHSTLLASYNVLMYLFSAVSNRPILQPERVSRIERVARKLANHSRRGLGLFGDGHIRTAARHNDWGFHSFFRSWSRFYLKWYEVSSMRCSVASTKFTLPANVSRKGIDPRTTH